MLTLSDEVGISRIRVQQTMQSSTAKAINARCNFDAVTGGFTAVGSMGASVAAAALVICLQQSGRDTLGVEFTSIFIKMLVDIEMVKALIAHALK